MRTPSSPIRPPRQHYPDRETQNEWWNRFRVLTEKPSPQAISQTLVLH